MIEKWQDVLDNSGETGAVLTDLSKAFDCIKHNLLITKLKAYTALKKLHMILLILTLPEENKGQK